MSLDAYHTSGVVYVAAHPHNLPEASRVFNRGCRPFPACTMKRPNYSRLEAFFLEEAQGGGEGGRSALALGR